MSTHSIKVATTEFEVFLAYLKLRLTLFLKEEAIYVLLVLVISQLAYGIAILVQMNSGAADIIRDNISITTLPLLWTITASVIFSRERKESHNLLTLTLPINPYHRFAMAALIAVIIVPLSSFVLTRLLYAGNLLLASALVQSQNVDSQVYANLTTKQFILSLFVFPAGSLGQLWFLPITFFFCAASILRKHVFIKANLILFIASLLLGFAVSMLLIIGILIDFNKIVNLFVHLMRHIILYEFILFVIGFILLTISYLFVRNFKAV